MVALRYDCKLPGTYSFQPVSLEHGWVFDYSVKSRVVDGLLYYFQGWILKGQAMWLSVISGTPGCNLRCLSNLKLSHSLP